MSSTVDTSATPPATGAATVPTTPAPNATADATAVKDVALDQQQMQTLRDALQRLTEHPLNDPDGETRALGHAVAAPRRCVGRNRR
ncbi:hypothetical protein [Paraburkholderia terrae]